MTAAAPTGPRERCSTACPADEDFVLGAALRKQAGLQPDKVFIRFDDGTAWTYAQALEEGLVCAGGLRALGVRQGELVAVWLPNGPAMVRAWFGLALLGAVLVPFNTGWRGAVLAHAFRNAEPRLAVVHADLAGLVAEAAPASLRDVVVIGAAAGDNLQWRGEDAMRGEPVPPGELPRVRPWDLHCIVYTSGTTGNSKGVLTSNMHLATMATAGRDMVTGDDHRLVTLPLFHAGGLLNVLGMLLKGGSLSLVASFKTATFWQTVRETRATTLTLLGAMTGFLMKAPVEPGERDHSLRSVSLVPYPADGEAFAKRFGVAVYTSYNSSETSNPLVSARDPKAAGVCGKPRPGVQARLVDDHDFDVPEGSVGELVLRTDSPWAMSHGYHRDPEATAATWRNGWFHTGELFRRDAQGDYFFIDRKKDALRRRGENVSSAEVEREILAHPAVLEAAVVGVPSEFGEDDVMAVVALRPGSSLQPQDLIAFVAPRMAHFMVPRYVRVVDALPRTETHKVQKYPLRKEGVTPDTWDRERAGIRVRPEPVG
ncbi:AMP-binding protein [Ramlibacter albus]|uniref:AMP-binding protein n=1 Tax=Ramlibacter albus TaxID=2079448 RepID=A0A923S4L6_9BURK|nr:AMP-binding protein [Ramlibacter albus]MBC5767048.1 AMP-binding protein [Ramlibacter albus]